ncbi:MAG TPA: hypothetical protein VEK76_03075 [Candidatus Binatia bacterium]|nr:hypothetical protein [Candidatus Binatia bacterium]
MTTGWRLVPLTIGVLVVGGCGSASPPRASPAPPAPVSPAIGTPAPPVSPSPSTIPSPQATLAGCPAPVSLDRLTVLHHFTTDADDVAVDGSGHIWVSSPDAGVIDELAPDGSELHAFLDRDEPEGLVPLADGMLVVAQQRTNRLALLDPSTGTLNVLVTLPDPSGNLGVDGIALSAGGGNLLVPNSPEGQLLEVPVGGGSPTTLAAGLGRPVDANQMPDGSIVVAAESSPGLVEVAGGSTHPLGTLSDLDEAVPDGGLVYVTDLGADQVLAVDPGSGDSRVLVTGSPAPQGLAALPDGHLLLADSTDRVLAELSPCA